MDLTKEYGIVLDGGGARGAYQIGAWKALKEAGVKVCAVAGTSVGALNGAMICMDDVEKAEQVWSELTFSKVMDVDDAWMERLFDRENKFTEVISEVWDKLLEGGVDITPLREMIHELVDEEQIRRCGKEFCLITFSVSEWKKLDLSIRDIPEGQLEDFLLASAYLIGFKNEKLHGKHYVDGGLVNNLPLESLVERGYKNIIEIRIYGPGVVRYVKMPEDGCKYEIGPRVSLGSIIEFDSRRSVRNMKIGYYDAKRVIYGLEGRIYYLEQNHDDEWYEKRMQHISDWERAEMAFVLKLSPGYDSKVLYLAMLEASAKLLKVPKYQIYTVDELFRLVKSRYVQQEDQKNLPRFTHMLMDMREDTEMDMTINLKGRNFLTLKDFTSEEIVYLLDLAARLKEMKKNGIPVDYYKGKNVALIFEKTSTRTRCAFEVAAHDMGMGTTYLDPSGSQIGKKESIEDTARVLGRMFDGIEYRGFGQEIVEELAEYAGVPVWNGLTNEYHPTQMLADMLTIREQFGRLEGIKLVYMGDARYNMGNSLMIACAKLGMHFVACTTKEYFPNAELVELCKGYAAESGASITLTEDVKEATKDADVIYTDVWVSMGEPDEVWEKRIRDLSPYKVTMEVMKNAKEDAIFLHCLPALHDLKTTIGKQISERFGITDMEVTDEVFESEQSKVFDEAENRMHTIKAVMAATLGCQSIL